MTQDEIRNCMFGMGGQRLLEITATADSIKPHETIKCGTLDISLSKLHNKDEWEKND